jgi:alpha-glucosidase
MHEVWVDGPEQEAIRRRYIEERYRLMPYLYTVAEETSRDGLPIDRPLFLEFPHASEDGTPLDLNTRSSEFLFGSRILVAPSPYPEDMTPYTVQLPPGTWYDYWTGERFVRGRSGGQVDLEQRDLTLAEKQIKITPKLEQLPVYVRGGSILPIAPLTQSTSEIPQGPLTLRLYPLAPGLNTPGESCEGEVYTDDGHTFAYLRGEFARIHFACSFEPNGSLSVSIQAQEGTWKPWWHEYRVEVVGLTPKGKASLNGHPVPLVKEGELWGVTIPANAAGAQLQLR